jgi:hypothetical protein
VACDCNEGGNANGILIAAGHTMTAQGRACSAVIPNALSGRAPTSALNSEDWAVNVREQRQRLNPPH